MRIVLRSGGTLSFRQISSTPRRFEIVTKKSASPPLKGERNWGIRGFGLHEAARPSSSASSRAQFLAARSTISRVIREFSIMTARGSALWAKYDLVRCGTSDQA